MLSETGQLRLDEPSYLERSDCMSRVSTLGNAEEYAGCMEISGTAICLQVTLGYREVDSWWECYTESAQCDDAAAAHDLLYQLVKDARAILQPCGERELALVLGV